jgi:hypothetical protein
MLAEAVAVRDESVARTRQVHIEWLWKHCLLLSSYLKNELMPMDTGSKTVGASYLFRHSAGSVQLNPSLPDFLSKNGIFGCCENIYCLYASEC